jgi:hypothetical protein
MQALRALPEKERSGAISHLPKDESGYIPLQDGQPYCVELDVSIRA